MILFYGVQQKFRFVQEDSIDVKFWRPQLYVLVKFIQDVRRMQYMATLLPVRV
jgi:hypothetical protein